MLFTVTKTICQIMGELRRWCHRSLNGCDTEVAKVGRVSEVFMHESQQSRGRLLRLLVRSRIRYNCNGVRQGEQGGIKPFLPLVRRRLDPVRIVSFVSHVPQLSRSSCGSTTTFLRQRRTTTFLVIILLIWLGQHRRPASRSIQRNH